MKRTFAALTAVALAAGLSLAAVVAPASADDSTTPAPAASSTPTSTPTSTPSTAPVATTSATSATSSSDTTTPAVTPTPDPTAAPATTDTTDTTDPTTVVAASAADFSIASSTHNGNNPPSSPVYETILWSMAPGNGQAVTKTDGAATYPQIHVTRVVNEHNLHDALNALDKDIPATCGTSYQIDVYIQKSGNVDNTAALDALYASGLAGPNGAQDGAYLAPGGSGTAWKYVTNAVCPPCVPDSQITYTYNSANNTGEIVVPNPRGYSGVLCTPIYVTAASWTFDTNGQTWPQTINQSNHVVGVSAGNNLPISNHGHYAFGATVTCGQGDIYASITSNAATLFPESYSAHTGHLLGPSNPFSEYFLSDLASALHFTGSSNPTYMVTGNTCNTVTAPVKPTVDPITTCGKYGSITIPTTTPNVDYTFNGTVEPAGTVITGLSGTQSVVATPKSGFKFSGSQSVTYTLNAGTYVQDCDITVTDPTVAQPTCTGPNSPNNGSITIVTNTFVEYTLTGPGYPAPGTDFATSATNGTSETIGGLAAGVYTVTATGLAGHTISGSPTFSFPVNETTLTAPNCVEVAPVVSTVLPTCAPDPTQIKSAGLTATAAENEGQIVLPVDANVTYQIDPPSANVGDGSYIVADGTHTVTATLIPSKVAAGITFSANPGVYTLNADKTVATWTITFTSDCGTLPTDASWHSGAAGDPATCTASGALGTITVVHGSDAADPTDEAGKVTYTLVNNANGHTTNLGSTATTVNVAPGSYTVKATPTDPADGLVGNTNATNEIDYPVTIAAPTSVCGGNDRLAFTGGTIAWFGFVLAGGMLFLGIAFLLIRRRGNRTAE